MVVHNTEAKYKPNLTHGSTGTFGLREGKGGGGGDFLARGEYAMPEWVGVEIGMKTQTFTIFPSNETAIIGIPPLIKLLLTMSDFL